MAITLACECGKALQVPDDAAGKKGRCPSCGQVFQIPAGRTHVTAMPPPRAPSKKPPPLPVDDDLPLVEPSPSADEGGAIAVLRTHADTDLAEDDEFFGFFRC